MPTKSVYVLVRVPAAGTQIDLLEPEPFYPTRDAADMRASDLNNVLQADNAIQPVLAKLTYSLDSIVARPKQKAIRIDPLQMLLPFVD